MDKLNYFDKSTIKNNDKYLIIGKDGYGVHTVLKNVIYDIRNDFETSLMLSTYNKDKNDEYSSMIPELKVLNDNGGDNITKNTLYITDFIEQQKRKIRDQIFYTSTIDFNKNKCLVILNNIQQSWFKSNIIKFLFLNSKQFNITFIVLVTHPCLSPEFRCSMDYVFISKERDLITKKKIYNRYFGIIETFQEFDNIMNDLETISCLVIKQSSISNNYSDFIYIWKPQPLHNSKFICIDLEIDDDNNDKTI